LGPKIGANPENRDIVKIGVFWPFLAQFDRKTGLFAKKLGFLPNGHLAEMGWNPTPRAYPAAIPSQA
jgi:hypothetical protein